MRHTLFFVRLLFFLLLVQTSCKEETGIPVNDDNSETITVNRWIKEVLEDVYLWEKDLPTHIDYTKQSNSKDYFYKQMLSKEDHWSYITDDYLALKNQLVGVYTSFGFNYQFYCKDSREYDILVEINYIVPNSPAEKAGLKRGDIIQVIDGVHLNVDNYETSLKPNTVAIRLERWDAVRGEYVFEKDVSISKVQLEEDPIFLSKVIERDGIKVGYVVYNSFVDSESDSARMVNTFKDLEAQDIAELVLDVRYNRGGANRAAVQLASIIAPYSTVENSEILTRSIYNDLYNGYFALRYPTQLYDVFDKDVAVNLDLQRVYILTTKRSASASELVTIALEPYMNVVQIGETTFGKYTSMWLLDDEKDGKSHSWGMMPVVAKYANADGFTDFKNGLTPDYEVKDSRKNQLGDENELMLKAALAHISSGSVIAMKSTSTKSSRALEFGGGNPILKNGLHYIKPDFNK